MIRFMTAGESHGKGLMIIMDGVPSNVNIKMEDINRFLSERQKGYGRGGRQKIETDTAEVMSGLRFGKTTGAPLSFFIKNRDFQNWAERMDAFEKPIKLTELNVPRPGHADLSGGIKYNQHDYRNVLERASARETAARIIAGAVAEIILEDIGIEVFGFVSSIGNANAAMPSSISEAKKRIKLADAGKGLNLRFPDRKMIGRAENEIKAGFKEGDTLGGTVRIMAENVPAGLGDYTQWDKKLDAKIAFALMSLQAVKGVSFGAGFAYAGKKGSEMHDEIFYSAKTGFYRKSNNAGGIEGGMTNGSAVVVNAVIKPISTVLKGLRSVDTGTKKQVKTIYERSDICAVPAASLISETIVAMEILNAVIEKTGGDEMGRLKKAFEEYRKYTGKH